MEGKREFPARNPKISLARALSKAGYCSRSRALGLIREGRVSLNGTVVRDPKTRLDMKLDRLEADGRLIEGARKIYLMFNKPRGVVVTADDEKGRKTVYDFLADGNFPWLSPVGRLDKASEGLLLFTNDTRWAAAILDPKTHLEKTYHVQIDRIVGEDLLNKIRKGVTAEDGVFLGTVKADVLRCGTKNCWLEIILDEGKNRHIRRLLAAFGIGTPRIIRVAVGRLKLGNLGKGKYRRLTPEEVDSLRAKERKSSGAPPQMGADPFLSATFRAVMISE